MAVGVGKTLPSVTLSGTTGGTADGKAWHTKSLKGATRLILYMDPDQRKNIEPLMREIRRKSSPKFTTIAIINLAATWMPNRVLISKLNASKNKTKHTTYLFDKKRVLVAKWGLPDESTSVMVTAASGRVKYVKHGALSSSDVSKILKVLSR